MSTTDRIERETVIDAPVDRVWSLLTEAEHLGRWFGDAGAEIDLRPGGALALHWAEHGTAHGRVEQIEPGRRLALRWGAEPGAFEPSTSTHVEFTLRPEGDATRLRVVESGFDSLAGSPAERAAKHADNTEGWAIELGHLRDHARRVAV